MVVVDSSAVYAIDSDDAVVRAPESIIALEVIRGMACSLRGDVVIAEAITALTSMMRSI